jgi:hypothetical protein
VGSYKSSNPFFDAMREVQLFQIHHDYSEETPF